jgi:AcrR family transcriptional regulator
MVATGERKTKEARREEILDAALEEFAERGLHGASTEDIARRAGISQPYVFRIFGTKKQLFKAVVARCFLQTLEIFQRASEGKRGVEALEAMGEAYVDLLERDRTRLQAQMQAYAACDDPELREVVRNGYGDLVAYVVRVTALPPIEIGRFFAVGMLLNVISSMNLQEQTEPWGELLLSVCKEPE